MTIIVFLIDTSASMNQRTYAGPSFLDLAKGAVDTFLKFRARDPSSRGADRYMLLTFEEPPKNIKAGWRESQMVFMQELKNLKATSITTLGAALSNVFHLLNVNRLQSGIDNFGCGRFPHWLEPATIIMITDGGCMVNPNGTTKQTVEITPSQLPGSELVAEPFRWDQRVFSLVLRLSGQPPKGPAPVGLVPQDGSAVDAICEATGGRSYSIKTHKMMNQCLESLVQKIQSGVVVCFEKYGPDPPLLPFEDRGKSVPLENGFIHEMAKIGTGENQTRAHGDVIIDEKVESSPKSPSAIQTEPAWTKTRRMIYVSRGAGSRGYNPSHWTIPESFWPDHSVSALPPRSAQPIIKFKCDPQEPVFPADLPFDKYELEPSPLTQFILERKQPNVCWYCYVVNSSGKNGDPGSPFGYLKASTSLNGVTLTVLPYNFPALIPLMEEIKLARGKASQQWKAKFDRYLRSVPPYYVVALKAAFQKINLLHLLADFPDKHLSVNVQAHLAKIKLRAREEMERLNQAISQPVHSAEGIRVVARSTASSLTSSRRRCDNEFGAFRVHVGPIGGSNGHTRMSFRNPFDIQRDQLIRQMAKMRVNLQQSLNDRTFQLMGAKPGMKYRLQDVEELHQLPIGVMGNYQDYLRAMTAPLREIDAAPTRLHAFGNPFKVDKRMLVDEADIDNLVGTSSATMSSTQNAPGKSHSKKGGTGAVVDSSGTKSLQSASTSGTTSRRRKPGPLPKDYRYKRGSFSDELREMRNCLVDRVCPYSPASSVTSCDSDTDSEISIVLDGRMLIESIESDIVDRGDKLRGYVPEIGPTDRMTKTKRSSDDQIASSSTASSVSNKSKKRRATANGLDVVKSMKKKPPKIKWTPGQWLEVKREICALVRKPSQDYAPLLKRLNRIPKPLENDLFTWALSEAERFRREDLCQQLRKRLSSIKSLAKRDKKRTRRKH